MSFEIDICDWCKKPKREWTNTLSWRNQGRHYCSMACYSAGEYKVNRYLAACTMIILGIPCAFVVSQFLTDLTPVTIAAIVMIIISYLIFSSVALTCVILGRNKRIIEKSKDI